jgi:uncharacterized protein YpuA (DUF1002 family)
MTIDSNDTKDDDGFDDDSSLEEAIAAIVKEVVKDSTDLDREDVATLVSQRFSDAGIVLDEASIEELVSEIVSQS